MLIIYRAILLALVIFLLGLTALPAISSDVDRDARLNNIESSIVRVSGISGLLAWRYARIINAECNKYNYDWEFIVKLIWEESRFQWKATSRMEAVGLMQLRPSTVDCIFPRSNISMRYLRDPSKNISMGMFYIWLLEIRFGNLGMAIVAYNIGPTKLASMIREGYNWREATYLKNIIG